MPRNFGIALRAHDESLPPDVRHGDRATPSRDATTPVLSREGFFFDDREFGALVFAFSVLVAPGILLSFLVIGIVLFLA